MKNCERNITPAILFSIIRQSVIDFPVVNCGRFNAFSTVGELETINNASNVGKNYKDYLAGNFWARNWVNRGANANELKIEFPYVGIDWEGFRYTDQRKAKGCYKFTMLFVDKIDCPGCPSDCASRSEEQIASELFFNAMALLAEVQGYNLYYCFSGSQETCFWLSNGRAEHLQANGTLTNCKDQSATLCEYLKLDKMQLIRVNAGPNKVAYSISFDLCGCTIDKLDFNYAYTQPKEVAKTLCSSCA